ncbi:4-hydroxythreonine-4-phosphate dehydrogenase PdxA [Clostridium sp. AM58-1XD]|uniref:4-hydroxythreonine-4-phosphate dehydrogenase PdxA n=1 Tax=Clostridium sp. AM58-1XD TaxID=2292307 RepID=UPI001FA93E67|nr:4-hydroxythreonine-4-phosphate dehydrogenase PdxA [Clostridium sp. AM58-1XD]
MELTTYRPVIGVIMGDAAGIGSEIIAKAAEEGSLTKEARPVIIGDYRQLERGMEIAGADFPVEVKDTIEEAVKYASEDKGIVIYDTKFLDAYAVKLGELSAECGKDEAENMALAVKFCRLGLIEGFCFAPNNKSALKMAGYHLSGMVDFLAEMFEYRGIKGEININGAAFNARVTGHIPAKNVSAALSVEKILDTLHMSYDTVKRFGIEKPRVAVAALNPHGGENGTCGTEEIDIIAPAVETARKEGIDITGPLAADTLFGQLFAGKYDLALTMSHDQGQIAFKLINFDRVVTIYGGIPYPVGTGAHGTAYDIAGKGVAGHRAYVTAYNIVVQMCKVAAAKKCQEQD